MNNTGRPTLRFEGEPSWAERLARFLAPYDTRVFVTPTAYFDLGSGSLGALDRITNIHQPHGFTGCLGSIGRWCEFATSSEILGRGDHDHDKPVNVSLGALRPFSSNTADDVGMKPFKPFHIGSGVVVSAGARILSGADIGDGAVIGANTVVRRAAPFSVVAGSPAREIRTRPETVAWWDWSAEYLVESLPRIQDVAASPGPHRWRVGRPPFVLAQGARGYEVIGFAEGEFVRPISEAPESVRTYLSQAFDVGSREVAWSWDCWAT